MSTDNRTSVMLVDDHQVMRDLLRDAWRTPGSSRWWPRRPTGRRR